MSAASTRWRTCRQASPPRQPDGGLGRRALLLLLGVAWLAGCGAAGRARHEDAAQRDFPDPQRALVREGIFANVDNLRQLAPGMSKRQLYALLGPPHFNEGTWGVREWNYLLDFRTSPGSPAQVSCQLMVVFDEHRLASGYYWKPSSCAALIVAPIPPTGMSTAPPSSPPTQTLPAEPLRLAADALFAFDSAALTEQGRASVGALLQQIRAASEVEDIEIVGYTDRLGSERYNRELSQRRADAVRDVLIQRGVPATALHTDGRGEARPLVACNDRRRSALIACLAPNRRVEISGMARRR